MNVIVQRGSSRTREYIKSKHSDLGQNVLPQQGAGVKCWILSCNEAPRKHENTSYRSTQISVKKSYHRRERAGVEHWIIWRDAAPRNTKKNQTAEAVKTVATAELSKLELDAVHIEALRFQSKVNLELDIVDIEALRFRSKSVVTA